MALLAASPDARAGQNLMGSDGKDHPGQQRGQHGGIDDAVLSAIVTKTHLG